MKYRAALKSLLAVICALAFSSEAIADPPQPAAAMGYTINSFSSTFTTSTVDLGATKQPGFQWYNWDLYGYHTDPSFVQINSDGSLTLLGNINGSIVSAVRVPGAPNNFVGTSIGGGAYVEAELKFDPRQVAAAGTGPKADWPAFWALPIEGNFIPDGNQWIGQPPGYKHNIEVDVLEFMRLAPGTPPNAYSASMHDWYGIYKTTCAPAGFCQGGMPYKTGLRIVPVGTDFTQYHRYGFAWRPATPTTPGYAKFFFDRNQVGPTTQWTLLGDQPPPPVNQPWEWGIIDREHLWLILSTGLNQPVTIRHVDVWQASTASNIVN